MPLTLVLASIEQLFVPFPSKMAMSDEAGTDAPPLPPDEVDQFEEDDQFPDPTQKRLAALISMDVNTQRRKEIKYLYPLIRPSKLVNNEQLKLVESVMHTDAISLILITQLNRGLLLRNNFT